MKKNRGFILYLLENKEDKVKYVFLPTYCSCENSNLDNIEVEIIDDDYYEYSIEFKEQIKNDEELDEDVIKTRTLEELDIFRLKEFPDFVSCIVPYKDANYTAKVKLLKYENNNIYARYHNQEGILKLIKNENSSLLLFKPLYVVDDENALKEYINTISDGLEKDYNIDKDECLIIIEQFQCIIKMHI